MNIGKLGMTKPWKTSVLAEMSGDKIFSSTDKLVFMFQVQKNTAKNENKGKSQYLSKK